MRKCPLRDESIHFHVHYTNTKTIELRPTYCSECNLIEYDCVGYLLRTLFKWDHLGRTHQGTSSSVLNRRVSDGELTQIETNQVWFNLNIDECLPVVNANNRPDHLWKDDGIAKVSSNWDWLLSIWALFFRLSKLLDQSHGTSLDASGKLSSLSRIEHLDDIGSRHIQKLLELDPTIGELSEGTGLLLLSKIDWVLDVSHNSETKGDS